MVQLLLERDGVDADSKDWRGRTPLSQAARNGYGAEVQLLLGNDSVDANSNDQHGWTPLLWATRWGHEVVVQLLLERDSVDADSKDQRSRTPLCGPCSWGTKVVVRLLLKRDGSMPTPRTRKVGRRYRGLRGVGMDRLRNGLPMGRWVASSLPRPNLKVGSGYSWIPVHRPIYYI